ncbi:MAG: hypothetical protein ABH857_04195 [Elusimicrobiota bacterium]
MFEKIEDITITYEEDGVVLVKEIDKEILSKGAWTTIVFKYKQWDPKTKEYGDDKYSIRRYKKQNGEFSQKSKFNISNKEQAVKIIECLNKWVELS